MKLVFATLTSFSLCLLGACAPVHRVILLPQEGGTPSAVEVRTKSETVVLSNPYATASINKNGGVEQGVTSAKEVAEKYQVLLSQQPQAALRFTLYFADGARLTPESEVLMMQALARAATRPGAEIFVTGHTDTTGALEINDALSLERAKAIRARLIAGGFKSDLIEAIGRGKRELAVPTADEVPEPQNRRVEILVR
jgi:OOP family OmpA-OmpF porin